MRPILVLLAAIALVPIGAHAKTWSVSCSSNGCVAIDDAGNLAFIDIEKQSVVGVDKLVDNPTPPFVISCGTQCVIVDGGGRLWFGPAKPGTPFKVAPDATLP